MNIRLDRIRDWDDKPSPGRDKNGYWITTSKEYKAMLKQLKEDLKKHKERK